MAIGKAKATQQDKRGKKIENAKDRRLEDGVGEQSTNGHTPERLRVQGKRSQLNFPAADIDLSLSPINCNIVIFAYSED